MGATVGDYIEFQAVASAGNPSNAYRMMGASNNNWTDLIELNPSNIFFRAGGNNSNISTASGYAQPALGIIFTFKAVKASASTWQIFLNGSPVGSPLANGGSITVGSLFAVQGPTTIESFRGGVYYVAFSTNGGVSATRYYDPSVGNGGSTTLIDTIGGQHGTYTGEWVTGARYMPYLDTTVSTPIVNQGVNGTANYFCTLNGTSYFTAPTLGNLLTGSPKIRINIKKFKYTSTGVQPIFWQGSGSAGGREFGLRSNYRGNVDFFYGGNSYSISWATLTAAFGDPDLACDEFGFEIDGTTIRYYKNKVVVLDLPNAFGRQGTARIDGALLFFGARPNTDSGGAFTAQDICAAGTQYGDIEILINDVLVRNYKNTNGNGAGYVDVLQPRPFALRYNAGGNRYMALPQAIIIANNQDFEIEFECAFNNDTDFRIFGATAGVNNRVILLKGTGATVVRLTPTGGNANEWTVTYTKTEFNVFRFKRVSNVIELFVNGVSQGTKTEADGFTSGVNSLFMQGGYYSDSGTVRFLKFTIGGVLQHHYVNLTGSGTSWTDIVSGNNATPINTWPTDNSQWIEYAHLQQRGTFTIDNNEWRQFIVYNTQSVASILKMWNGTAWVNAIIRYWNGSSWVDTTVKRFDGTQFN